MPGLDVTQEQLFSIRRTADFVPEGHPPVAMREILNRALRDMDLLFESMYEERDRYSVPPEWLLRGLVLQGCTESAANGCCASSWATTCCTAGLSVWGWRMRRGITPPTRFIRHQLSRQINPRESDASLRCRTAHPPSPDPTD